MPTTTTTCGRDLSSSLAILFSSVERCVIVIELLPFLSGSDSVPIGLTIEFLFGVRTGNSTGPNKVWHLCYSPARKSLRAVLPIRSSPLPNRAWRFTELTFNSRQSRNPTPTEHTRSLVTRSPVDAPESKAVWRQLSRRVSYWLDIFTQLHTAPNSCHRGGLRDGVFRGL